MNQREMVKLSKRMSLALRHAPARFDLALDEGGWVRVDDLLAALRITRQALDTLGLAAQEPPSRLYHGTTAAALTSIRATGLHRGRRHHVHLSGDVDTAIRVGARRAGSTIVLTVDAAAMAQDGHAFYRSANGVWLTDEVPPRYLDGG